MTARPQLAAYIAATLADEPDGLPCGVIARRLGMRDGDVRAVLRRDPWFVRTGSARYTRWHLVAGPDGPDGGRVGTRAEPPDVLELVLGRLVALEARMDVLERTNGTRAHP